jgi:tetratricopeptide (TPR) repeat protein
MARDKHVSSCQTCAGALESLRAVTTGLQEATVWDERELPETPNRQTKNAIRGFAAAVSAEDREAESFVRQLLAADSDRRRAMLQRNPEWRTAGVVRRILAAVDDVNFTDPKRAVDLTVLATDIAESLDPAAYPADTAMKVRATAWRERAYALYYVGSYTESLAALDRVDESLARCLVSEFDGALAQLVRAKVYAEIQKIDEGIALARMAKTVFASYGNVRRKANADATEAAMLMRAGRYEDALITQLQLANHSSLDEMSRVCALNQAAYCYRELSRFDEAKALYAKTIPAFERLGLMTMRLTARWNLGRVMLAEGRFEQSLTMLSELRDEARDLGLAHDVALISLDVSEALLMMRRQIEVAALCQSAMAYFAQAGLAYTAGAMTALAYLREAAESGTLNVGTLHEARAYFEVLPKQPQLQFAHSS